MANANPSRPTRQIKDTTPPPPDSGKKVDERGVKYVDETNAAGNVVRKYFD